MMLLLLNSEADCLGQTMSETLQPNPLFEAIDLIRANLDGMRDEELEEHAAHVVAVLQELNDA